MPDRKIIVLFLILACIITYANSFKNNFVWDDAHLIVNNSYIKEVRCIPEIFKRPTYDERGRPSNLYRPIQLLLYLIIYKVFGLNPVGYHSANLLLHIGNVILGYLIFALLLPKSKIPFYASIIFAVHPLNTEAVTYISGSADLLGCFFTFLSILLFIRSYYILSLFSFSLAIFSKEATVITPLIFLFYILWYRPFEKKRLCLKTALFIIPILIYGIFRFSNFSFANFDRTMAWQAPLKIRLLTETKAILIYLKLLFLPFGLHMERAIPESVSLLEKEVLFSIFIISSIFVTSVLLLKRGKAILFGVIWFFIFLFPSLNVVPLNAMLSEHWIYLSAIGLFVSIFAFLNAIKLFRRVFVLEGILIVALGFFSFLTIQQNKRWFNDITIFTTTLKYAPHSGRAHYSLGSAYLRANFYEAAKLEYKMAISIMPDYSPAYVNLGSIYYEEGKKEDAKILFEKAIQLSPNLFEPRKNLGDLYFFENKWNEAIRMYKTSLHIRPKDLDTHNKLGVTYLRLNAYEQAKNEFMAMLNIDPNCKDAFYNLACLYSRTGVKDKALKFLERAIERGFSNFELLKTDKDLDNIRKEARFTELLKFSKVS